VTRAAASVGCAVSDGGGKDGWIVIGGANYKISPFDPIGLPSSYVFSTSSEGGVRTHLEAFGMTEFMPKHGWNESVN
jgi:hypothetical protein